MSEGTQAVPSCVAALASPTAFTSINYGSIMGCKPIRNMNLMQSDTQLFKATLALACATCDTFMWVYVERSGHLVVLRLKTPSEC